ncbi:iron complex transport system substrate-binding protein [Loktanella fryxellensis]|uniref:Iron complex transport system substrate-binding protein n=1 Tax=Loktanella fryxellensis TaxID=245187 RepID=A0A1H8IPT8_9RHOB|nr:siderophore ABC transporter substrate-binding protein [Loktanella fryxellensis]SEN70429.1 iron complex transport system substrate-binding protein [Loktanella fryxellensis]
MTPIHPIFLALALGLTAALPEAAQITITHVQGDTVLPAAPETVLVYDMATLDTLDALGVPVAGAPAGALPEALQGYGADIGTLFEPDLEAVNAAGPDLVIVGGRSAPKLADLSQIAPTIDMSLDRTDYLASAQARVTQLGEIFDKQDAAAAALADLDAQVADLQVAAADAGRVLVILTTGGRISAHGPGSRFGVVHDDFGFAPAATGMDTGTHGQSISFEFIRETNPDWLFVVDRDAAIGREGTAAAQLLDNDLVRTTTAWQQDQVVYLDAADWYLAGGGLSALQDSVTQLLTAAGDAS